MTTKLKLLCNDGGRFSETTTLYTEASREEIDNAVSKFRKIIEEIAENHFDFSIAQKYGYPCVSCDEELLTDILISDINAYYDGADETIEIAY